MLTLCQITMPANEIAVVAELNVNGDWRIL